MDVNEHERITQHLYLDTN